MPDDDRIPRSLTARWRKVYRCLQRHEPIERTTDAVVGALAETLRSGHGVPDIQSIAAQMQQSAAGDPISQSRIPDSAQARRHAPTDIAERAAAALASTMPKVLALTSPEKASLMLARTRRRRHRLSLWPRSHGADSGVGWNVWQCRAAGTSIRHPRE